MFCYSLLECPNNVCVCVCGGGSCGWTCMCMLWRAENTLGMISQVWTTLHFEIWSLAVGDRVSPPTPRLPAPGLQAYATMRSWDVFNPSSRGHTQVFVLARQVLYQQSHLLRLRQYFNNCPLGDIYYTYLKIRIWRTVRNISFVSNPYTCFSGFCLKPVASVFTFLPSHPLLFLFTAFLFPPLSPHPPLSLS